jgi:translation initiation factor 1
MKALLGPMGQPTGLESKDRTSRWTRRAPEDGSRLPSLSRALDVRSSGHEQSRYPLGRPVTKPFHNPFEVLANLPDPKPAHPERAVPSVPRAVVRLERSGRKGKEVTVVDHLDLTPAERDTWLQSLKAALGCGGTIEGESLVLQGDHRNRLPGLLTKRGVKKVTVG